MTVGEWQVRNGDYVEDFSVVLAMARHEGIDPTMVREELFPMPVDLANMQYDDLVKLIQANPARLDNLAEDAIDNHPHLVDTLEKAANSLGYFYGTNGFELRPPPAVLAAAAEPVVDEADIGTASTVAAIDAVDEQPEVWADFDPAPPAATASPAKKLGKKAKAAAKRTPLQAAKKPNTAAPGKKPAKPSKAAPAPAKVLKPADAWPFPKSSNGKREAAPAAAEQPPTAEVTA